MVRRMAASRKAMEDDPHRPLYHFVSPENTLNDPNGLCFWQGRWHLFYQGYPPEDPRPHWGHAISDDLVHWRDLPYAIYPDPEECCFSGGAPRRGRPGHSDLPRDAGRQHGRRLQRPAAAQLGEGHRPAGHSRSRSTTAPPGSTRSSTPASGSATASTTPSPGAH